MDPAGVAGASQGRWRSRGPVILLVAACVAAVVVAVSGAAKPFDGLHFFAAGHWVYNAGQETVFHIDGASKQVDGQLKVDDAEDVSGVVQDGTSGYVLGRDTTIEFGKSDLQVKKRRPSQAPEVPLTIEVNGGPYAVYQEAGKIVRLGANAVGPVDAGGQIGSAVATSDGTLWFHVTGVGNLCHLGKTAQRPTCPAGAPGNTGALTVVNDKPVFVNTSSDTLQKLDADGLGEPVSVQTNLPPDSRAAASDVAGNVAILDDGTDRLHLVDPAGQDNDVQLDRGDYEGPASSGDAVTVLDRDRNRVHTYDGRGGKVQRVDLPGDAGRKPLSTAEDGRVYADNHDGSHVAVVDHDGKVEGVDVDGAGRGKGRNRGGEGGEDRGDEGRGEQRGDGGQGQQRREQPERRQQPSPEPPPTRTQDPPPEQSDERPNDEPNDEPKPTPASPPGAPPSVSAKAADRSANVSWGAAAGNGARVTQYRITWNGGSKTVSGGTRSTRVTGLTNGAGYAFTVAARNSAGTGQGADSQRVTPRAPQSSPKIALTRGPNTDQYCDPPDCAWMHVVMTGFEPNTSYHLQPHSSNADYGNEGATHTTDANGRLEVDRFAYGNPGDTVWVTTQTPGGTVKSNELVWPEGEGPMLVVSRGEDSSSDACEAPDCAWLHVVMYGFEPDTEYTVTAEASEWGDFSEPSTVTTNSEGRLVFEDIRFDGGGQDVWVYTNGPNGRVESNRYYWEPQ